MRIPIFCILIALFTINSACSKENSVAVANHGSENNTTVPQASVTPTGAATEFADPKQAAINALSKLKQLLIEGQNFREMGFDNLEQVDRASLSEPVSVYTVGINQLRDYTPGSDPQALLVDVNRMMFPIVADGSGRTLITVERNDGKWHFVSFGDQRIAGNLVKVRENKSTAPGGVCSSDYFVVQVRALFLTFLGNWQPGSAAPNTLRLVPLNGKTELQLSPAFRNNRAFLTENPRFNAEEEGAMRAKDVFRVLSSTAKQIDTSTPF